MRRIIRFVMVMWIGFFMVWTICIQLASAQTEPSTWVTFVNQLKYMQANVWGRLLDRDDGTVCRITIRYPRWMFESQDPAVVEFVKEVIPLVPQLHFRNFNRTENIGDVIDQFDRDPQDCGGLGPPPSPLPTGDAPPKVDWSKPPFSQAVRELKDVMSKLGDAPVQPVGIGPFVQTNGLALAVIALALIAAGTIVITRRRRVVLKA